MDCTLPGYGNITEICENFEAEDFMEYLLISYLEVIKKYAEFTGRARRREFWMFSLCNFVISIVFSILSRIPFLGVIFTIAGGLFALAVFVPALAVGVRRLHDTNKSGLLILLLLAPVVGWIILLVFFAQEGNPGNNLYGSDPKVD